MSQTASRQVYNIGFVGDHKVGKSSLIATLNMQAFNPMISQTEKVEVTTALLSFPDGE